jgi:phospholipid/cholesterol/gamma-HCH transport system permease protein
VILAGRSGSAMTAGIGSMHLTGEYDALRAFGSSPSLRLALPRVVGATITLPLLVVWTDFAALIGGAVTAQMDLGVGFKLFLAQLPQQIQIVNFWIGLAKGALFGLTIALIGCWFGMSAPPDTAGLSRHTTLSVVTSLTLILLFDASSGALLTHVGLL